MTRPLLRSILHVELASVRLLFLLVLGFVVSSCSVGGDLIQPASEKTNSILVPVPTIVSPAESIYYSQQRSLNISGQCQNKSTIKLISVASLTQIECQNSSYQFAVSQAVDGLYYYSIQQVLESGETSYPVSLVWIIKSTVAQPVLNSPSSNPYASSEQSLTLSGVCENSATVSVTGAANLSAVCANSVFNFNIPKSADGDYNFTITQTDKAGNSASRSLLWRKYNLSVLPAVTSLIVDRDLQLTIRGGSESYTVTIIENNSGATYNSSTQVYHSGQIANVTDKIKIIDSLGSTVYLLVTTQSASADHLNYATQSGQSQSTTPSTLLSMPFKAKVVDAYDNPVSLFPVYMSRLNGQGEIVSGTVQVSDLFGEVSFYVKTGFEEQSGKMQITSLGQTLADINGTGRSKLTFDYSVQYQNNLKFGQEYVTGQNPTQVVSLDFNKDGLNDFVVLNNSDPSISVYKNIGQSLFRDLNKITGVCPNPIALQTADMNSDTFLDLVVLCGNADFNGTGQNRYAFQIFYGDGQGGFANRQDILISANEVNVTGFLITDVNRDQKLDLVLVFADFPLAVTQGHGGVSIRYGNGLGGFSAPDYFEAGQGPRAVVAGHFLSTTELDLAVLNEVDSNVQFFFWQNTAAGRVTYDRTTLVSVDNGAFQMQPFIYLGSQSLAVLNNTGTINIIKDDGTLTGGYALASSLVVDQSALALHVFDVNQDGLDDLSVAYQNTNQINIFAAQADGSFESHIIETTSGPADFTLSRFNSDNLVDLVVVGLTQNVAEFLPQKSIFDFGDYYPINEIGNNTRIMSFDFNGDQKDDIALMNPVSKKISLYANKGLGLFSVSPDVTITLPSAPSFLMAYDIKNRGLKDIVVTLPNLNRVRILWNDGTGHFTTFTDLATENGPSFVAIADLNRDGLNDIVVTNSQANSISVFYAQSAGVFASGQTKAVAQNPVAVAIADFNEDNVLDVVVLSRGESVVQVLTGSGQGSLYFLSIPVRYLIGTDGTADPVALRVVDLDRDGHLDIVTANSGDSTVSFLKGNGSGGFATSVQSAGMDSPTDLIVGDFNSDGFIDVIETSNVNTNMLILKGRSSGSFTTPPVLFDTSVQIDSIAPIYGQGDKLIDFIVFDNINYRMKYIPGR